MIDKRDGFTKEQPKTVDNMFPRSEPKPLTGNVPKSQRPGGKTPPCEK